MSGFVVGARVRFALPGSTMVGTVTAMRGLPRVGGGLVVVVHWDSGSTGRHRPIDLEVVDEEILDTGSGV